MDFEKAKERLISLIEQGKHSELRGALMMLNEVDIAKLFEELDEKQLLLAFRISPKDISADVFSYMSNEQKQALVELIGDKEINFLMEDMYLDDAVDFLEELPAIVVKRLLQNTSEQKRKQINQFLSYPDDSAGSVMTIEYLDLHEGTLVKEAMDIIRGTGMDKETIYTLFIIDNGRHLLGTLALRTLIMAQDDVRVEDIMEKNVISVKTLDDQEYVADTVRKYDIMSMPVVDNENRLVGIITVDDVMDVIEEENTEDFEKMAALTPSENEYLKTSPFKLALNRIPWLLLMATVAIFTGMIITNYEALLRNASLVLTACIPMLMDAGGNCGSQASTLMIRGIALGEISLKDIWKVMRKEFVVGLIVGFVLFVFTFLRVVFVNQASYQVAFVVSIGLYVTVMMAKALGCTLPLVAKKIGFDPAIMASPLITTLVDLGSLSVYFYIATLVLPV